MSSEGLEGIDLYSGHLLYRELLKCLTREVNRRYSFSLKDPSDWLVISGEKAIGTGGHTHRLNIE